MKADEKSPNPQMLKAMKKEPEDRPQGSKSKSPHNGWVFDWLDFHQVLVLFN